MPTSELVSTAKTLADLDKAYTSALKALSKLGIDMRTKKPDAAKVGPAMEKGKKPSEFRLVGDKGIIKLQVETKDFSSVLGVLDTKAEKDAQKYLLLMENLAASGLISKAELKDAQDASRPDKPVDPTVVKNFVAKLKQLKAQREAFSALTITQVMANKPMLAKLREHMERERNVENLDFLEAVDKKLAPQKIIADFIGDTAKNEVNLDSAALKAAQGSGGKPDFGPAYKNILALVARDSLTRFKTILDKAVDKQISDLRIAGKKAGVPEKLLT